MMKRPRKRARRTALLLPSAEELERRRDKLPKFKRHDLVTLSGGSGKTSTELILKLRDRNNEQLRTLVAALGVDPADPKYWEKAFFLLAHYCVGVGCMRLRAPKPRSNSSSWTGKHELYLIHEVIELTKQGISDRKAIEMIMADSDKRGLFPYRPQRDTRLGTGYYRKSRRDDDERSAANRDPRTMAVHRHWQKMKAGRWSKLIAFLTRRYSGHNLTKIEFP